MEAVRRTLVTDSGVDALVDGRVFPEDNKITNRLTTGDYPLVTFAMLDESEIPCGRIDGTVQISVIHRALEKKTLWDIHRAIELALHPKLIQAASEQATDLRIRVALFRLNGVEDNLFDEPTDTYRLRSQWNTKYVRKP